jgi:hypothetical protein
MALRNDLKQEAQQLNEVIRASCQLLDSRKLPDANRERLQREVDVGTAARKALLKRLWVSPRGLRGQVSYDRTRRRVTPFDLQR